MSGLDNIKSQILEEAYRLAERKTARAKVKAERILEDAKSEVEAEVLKTAQKSKAEFKAYAERMQSACEMQRRKAVLQAKQEVIESVIEKAYAKVLTMETEEYFEMMERILEANVQPKDGKICFCERDLKRMPKEFEGKIEKIAAKKGGSLILQEEPILVDGGFILAYGEIEENCTIRAIFYEKREELSDKVHGLLFA